MQRTTHTALAAAMLLCLAMAGAAIAQPPATDDIDDAPLSTDAEDMQAIEDGQTADDDSWTGDETDTVADSDESFPPDDSADATAAAQDDTTSEPGRSETGRVRDQLKRMLIGVLMPAVERRVRKAVDSDDETVATAGPELEPGP